MLRPSAICLGLLIVTSVAHGEEILGTLDAGPLASLNSPAVNFPDIGALTIASPEASDERTRRAVETLSVAAGEDSRLEEPPLYSGDVCDMSALSRWYRQQMSPSLFRSGRILNRSVARYNEVFEFNDAETSMVAAARIGSLYASYRSLLLGLPNPSHCWPETDSGCSYGSFGSVDEGVRAHAVEAFEFCTQVAVTHRLYGRTSQQCFESLSELQGWANPPPSELVRGEPWESR